LEIVKNSLEIASNICIYTNSNIITDFIQWWIIFNNSALILLYLNF
jgi:hypothetical protein